MLAGAAILWAVSGAPVLAAFVLSYLAVWTLFARAELIWSKRASTAVLLAACAVLLLVLIGRFDRIAESEQLEDLDVVLADRWRASDLPAIAPPIAHTDRPNRYYVYAPDADTVKLRFGGSKRGIELVDLGHGLFLGDVDPREISEDLTIDADGELHQRRLAVIRPSPHPRWISARDGAACAVSTETDELFRFAGGWTAIPVDDRPTDCAVLAGGIAVIHESGTIALTSSTTRIIGSRSGKARPPVSARSARCALCLRIDLGAPLVHIAAGPDSLAVTRSEPRPAVVYLSRTLEVRAEIPLSFDPDWIAIDRDGILVSSARTRSIHAIRGGRETARLFLGRPAVTMALDPERRVLYAAVTDYRPEDDAGPNHHIEDQILEIDARTLSIARRIPTAPHVSPYAIALGEERITIAFAGSDEVIRFDRSFRELERFPYDRPTGVAELGGDPIIASAANGMIGDLSLGRPDPLLLAGERAFYQATRSGPSCQTCHLHGGSDFSLHDIGHGAPRPTLDPRGKARTAPYLRGASYPSIAALEAFTTYVLGGYEEPIADRADALDAYVSSLSRPSPRPAPDLEILRRGNDAFVEAGCDFCHRYPAFTDLAQVPEGFLFPERKDELHLLDTPSLIGVADSAPYLYDGRAKTLEEVLVDFNQSGRHGGAARLAPAERDALLLFLRSL